jgi:hypothetical protein
MFDDAVAGASIRIVYFGSIPSKHFDRLAMLEQSPESCAV